VVGAVVWFAFRLPRGNIGVYAGLAMVSSAAIVAIQPLIRSAGISRALLALVGASVIGGTAELIGLYMPVFGIYEYRPQWAPFIRISGDHVYPLQLPVTWGVILTVSYAFARQRAGRLQAVCLAALITAIVDLVSEAVLTGPVAFWIWLEPTPLLGAPVTNVIGWLVTSLLGCAWIALVLGGRIPAGPEPGWMLIAALAGVCIIGVTYAEFRALSAFIPLVGLVLWRGRGDSV